MNAGIKIVDLFIYKHKEQGIPTTEEFVDDVAPEFQKLPFTILKTVIKQVNHYKILQESLFFKDTF